MGMLDWLTSQQQPQQPGIGGGDASGYIPWLLAGGAALQQVGQGMQPSRLPVNGIGTALSALGAGAQGYATGSLLGPQADLAKQKAALNAIQLDYYTKRQAQRNGQPGAPAGNIVGNVMPGAPGMPPGTPMMGGAPGSGQPQTAPGGGGFMLSPQSMLANANDMSGVPGLEGNALQYLKLYESAVPKYSGVQDTGNIAPFPGAEPTLARTAYADALGKTVAENNKDQVVPAGGALFNGPRTLGEVPASLQQGNRPSFVNPNPTAQNIINMPGAAPFFETLGKDLGTEAAGVLSAGDTAAKQLQVIQAQRDLLDLYRQGGGSQGVSEPMKVRVAAIMQSLGVDPSSLGLPKDAGPAQALEALSKKAALGNIGPGGLPANNFSEADRKFIQSMQGGLGDTPAGWEAKTLVAQRIAERSIEAQQSLAPTIFGSSPQEAPQRYLQWKTAQNANNAMRPLFTPEDKAKLAELSKIDAQASGNASAPTKSLGGKTYRYVE